MTSDVLRAHPGDLCTCGHPATTVVHTPDGTWVGVCGRDNGGAPDGGWCLFCGNEERHDRARVNEDGVEVGVFRQGGKCPRYQLRMEET